MSAVASSSNSNIDEEMLDASINNNNNNDNNNDEMETEKLDDISDDEGADTGDTDTGDNAEDDTSAEVLPEPISKEIEKEQMKHLKQIREEQKAKLEEIRRQQNEQIQSAKDKSTEDRFKYLLKQTEIFAHFVNNRQAAAIKKAEEKKAIKRKGRISERQEDEEILKETMDDIQHPEFTTRLTVSPVYIKSTTLRDYQLAGLNWLIKLFDNGINGILADEMGLGKTLQTISLLGYLKHFRGIHGPHLVIVPKSVMHNWMNEIKKFCPTLKAIKFHGNQEERNRIINTSLQPGKFDVCVTSYETVIREKAALKKFNWRYIIIDEAHRIKNEHSVLSQCVRLFSSQFRLLLTGTPLQNNLHELWALLNFLLPEVFDNAEDFDKWFNLKEGHAETEIVGQLHKILKPFMLRRLKTDVEHTIPPKKEIYVECGMSEMQRTWYRNILTKDISLLNASGNKDKVRLLNICMQLRKCCNHPYLFEGAEPGPPYTTDEHLIYNSGKMILLDKLLNRLKERGSRVLIFSQMTRMLDILEDYLRFRGYDYCRIDGQSTGEQREAQMEEFNKENSPKFAFLLSTRAGGLGINLATADTVIIYDSDWNPQADLQAQDRAHRIGQKKPVNVFRLITKDSIEEKVYQRAVKKLYLDAVVVQQGRLAEQNKALSKNELLAMIRFGAEAIFQSKDSTITDEDLDSLLERGAQKAKEIDEDMKRKCQNNLLTFSLTEDENLYEFEGLDFSQKPTKILVIDNIDAQVTEDQLRGVFGKFGIIKTIAVDPSKNKAVIHFKTVDSAIQAKEALQGKKFPPADEKKEGEEAAPAAPETAEAKKPEEGGMVINFGTKNDAVVKSAVLSTISEPTKRERKGTSYAVDQYYRQALKTPGGSKQPQGPKLPKQPNFQDFQFMNTKRLNELYEKEKEYIIAMWERKNKSAEEQSADEPEPEGLTEKEQKEKEKLMAQGFPNWNRRDFQAFLRGCEKYGREDIKGIATEVEGKTEEEVEAYSKVFWKKIKTLQNYESIIKRIEKGEATLQKRQEYIRLLKWKTSKYQNPWADLKLSYGQNKGKQFRDEEDRFIVCMTSQLGYGSWDELKEEIRRSWEFRFDYFLKSRSTQELQRRCDSLINIIRKEYQEESGCNGQKATTSKSTGAKGKSTTKASSSKSNGKKTTKVAKKAAQEEEEEEEPAAADEEDQNNNDEENAGTEENRVQRARQAFSAVRRKRKAITKSNDKSGDEEDQSSAPEENEETSDAGANDNDGNETTEDAGNESSSFGAAGDADASSAGPAQKKSRRK